MNVRPRGWGAVLYCLLNSLQLGHLHKIKPTKPANNLAEVLSKHSGLQKRKEKGVRHGGELL